MNKYVEKFALSEWGSKTLQYTCTDITRHDHPWVHPVFNHVQLSGYFGSTF